MYLETKEDKQRMNKRGLVCLVLIFIICFFSIPVYGKEISMKREGNIKAMEEQIMNLYEDYLFLENEIRNLLEECR